MAEETRPSAGASGVLAFMGFFVGAILAPIALGTREWFTGYQYKSRYFEDVGGAAFGAVVGLVSIICGAILGVKLGWRLGKWLAAPREMRDALGFLGKQGVLFWVPLVILALLFYIANFG